MKKILSLIVISIHLMSGVGFCANEWRAGTSANTVLGSSKAADLDISTFQNMTEPLDRVLSNYRENCAIYYISGTSIGVKAGEVVCSSATGTNRRFRANTSALTLTEASNMDSGVAFAASTTYYVFAVSYADSENFTGVITTNATTPVGATYTPYKKLGSFTTDSSTNILNDDSLINYNNYYALRMGDRVSKSVNTTYQASTDIFVSVTGASLTNQIYADESEALVTAQNASAMRGQGEGGCFTTVKKNEYWRSVDNGSPAISIIPLEREV